MMGNEKPDYTHEERVKFVQQAAEKYYAGETGGPAPMKRDFIEREKARTKKYRYVKRISTIAAAVIVAVLVGNAVFIMITGDDAYGDKGLLHRIYKSKTGLNTDEQDEELLDYGLQEAVSSYTIKSMDDIEAAIHFADGRLYVPEYVPSGFELQELTIEELSLGDWNVDYTFKNGEKELQLVIAVSDGDGTVSSEGDGELIRLEDRVLYLQGKDEDGINCVGVFTEDAMMQLMCPTTDDEMIKIAKGIKLRH